VIQCRSPLRLPQKWNKTMVPIRIKHTPDRNLDMYACKSGALVTCLAAPGNDSFDRIQPGLTPCQKQPLATHVPQTSQPRLMSPSCNTSARQLVRTERAPMASRDYPQGQPQRRCYHVQPGSDSAQLQGSSQPYHGAVGTG